MLFNFSLHAIVQHSTGSTVYDQTDLAGLELHFVDHGIFLDALAVFGAPGGLHDDTVTQLELLALRDMSAKRRKAGVELATELEVKYRREGRFFDEILKGE